jgi:hypothetical protein
MGDLLEAADRQAGWQSAVYARSRARASASFHDATAFEITAPQDGHGRNGGSLAHFKVARWCSGSCEIAAMMRPRILPPAAGGAAISRDGCAC